MKNDKIWYAIETWWPNRKEKVCRDFIKRCIVLLKNKRIK